MVSHVRASVNQMEETSDDAARQVVSNTRNERWMGPTGNTGLYRRGGRGLTINGILAKLRARGMPLDIQFATQFGKVRGRHASVFKSEAKFPEISMADYQCVMKQVERQYNRNPETCEWPSAIDVWRATYLKNGTWSVPNGEEILNNLQTTAETNQERIAAATIPMVEHFALVLSRKPNHSRGVGVSAINQGAQERKFQVDNDWCRGVATKFFPSSISDLSEQVADEIEPAVLVLAVVAATEARNIKTTTAEAESKDTVVPPMTFPPFNRFGSAVPAFGGMPGVDGSSIPEFSLPDSSGSTPGFGGIGSMPIFGGLGGSPGLGGGMPGSPAAASAVDNQGKN
uniref:Uncharacterized protein n=1 Tax=Oryza punctata TaxID=4537 RepID=A0A0E0JYI6_ORYPU